MNPAFNSPFTRRRALQIGGLGMFGLTLPKILAAEAKVLRRPARAKSVVFLYQWGGPSHLDMFDMKPDAPDQIRGPYKPIKSSAPGILVSEKLPNMSKVMDRVTLIRSMTHTMKNHNSAGYYALRAKLRRSMISACAIRSSCFPRTVPLRIACCRGGPMCRTLSRCRM